MDEDKKKEVREIAMEVAAVVNEDLKSQFKVFGEDLLSVKKTVDLISEDMDSVKSDIVDIKLELKIMNGKLDNKAEKEVVVDHEKRLVGLENAVLPKVA